MEDISCLSQDYIDATWIKDFSTEVELEDYSIVLQSKHTELYLQVHQYKFIFAKHIQLFDFQT